MDVIRTDCLVIGAGLAGSVYALHAARAGLNVQLLSLGGSEQANSNWAQGGIIYDTSTQPESLARDIMAASGDTANPAAVDQLVIEGPKAVRNLLLEDSLEPVAIVARKTILATGGLGQIYQHSTNRPGTAGHGLAMAYRVGARLIDLEYVQFHPTVFYDRSAPRFLITEALRGEGATLVNGRGEPFMDAVHPRGSLAPRDIVARAIHHEMTTHGEACVYLDTSALKPGFASERFPSIYQRCLKYGVDIGSEPIPVVPAAHYSCGGVHTDLEGRTNVRHLNAIGETACTGLHGANRLASTSLLECLTGARFTARADVRDIQKMRFSLPDPRPWKSPHRDADPTLIQQDLNLVRQTMWNYAGIVRSQRRLTRARRILLELREEVQSFYSDCRLSFELIELRNAVQTALLVVHAAALNPDSKGCHYVVSDD